MLLKTPPNWPKMDSWLFKITQAVWTLKSKIITEMVPQILEFNVFTEFEFNEFKITGFQCFNRHKDHVLSISFHVLGKMRISYQKKH